MVKTCGPSPRERHGTRHSSITSISRGSSLGADVAVPCHAVEAVRTYQAGIFRRHPLSSLEAAYVSVSGHAILTPCGHLKFTPWPERG